MLLANSGLVSHQTPKRRESGARLNQRVGKKTSPFFESGARLFWFGLGLVWRFQQSVWYRYWYGIGPREASLGRRPGQSNGHGHFLIKNRKYFRLGLKLCGFFLVHLVPTYTNRNNQTIQFEEMLKLPKYSSFYLDYVDIKHNKSSTKLRF